MNTQFEAQRATADLRDLPTQDISVEVLQAQHFRPGLRREIA